MAGGFSSWNECNLWASIMPGASDFRVEVIACDALVAVPSAGLLKERTRKELQFESLASVRPIGFTWASLLLVFCKAQNSPGDN
jgi:hypothetical protein